MTDFTPDWPHGHRTRDGRPARMLQRLTHSKHLVFLVDEGAANEAVVVVTSEGKYYHNVYGIVCPNDLLNAPAPKRVWEGWAAWPRSRVCPVIGLTKEWAEDYVRTGGGGPIALACIEFPGESP